MINPLRKLSTWHKPKADDLNTIIDAVNRLSNITVTGPGTRALSDASVVIEVKVVDSVVDGVGDAIRAGGRFIRPIQTGRVQNYLLLACLMVLALVVTFFIILCLQI